MSLQPALLLLGPTGSGKTPLGRLLEQRGLWNKPCRHFDFGDNLRSIAAQPPDDYFTPNEINFIKDVLTRGALLEDRQFPLACKILDAFIVQRQVSPADLLVLNGLPRHRGQAERLAARLKIERVFYLSATPEVIIERLRRNIGGDRTGRTDDDLPAVQAKLLTFNHRTLPLLDYYRTAGVPLTVIDIGPATTAEEIREKMAIIDRG